MNNKKTKGKLLRRKDLIEIVSETADLPKHTVATVFDHLCAHLHVNILAGNSVQLQGTGKISSSVMPVNVPSLYNQKYTIGLKLRGDETFKSKVKQLLNEEVYIEEVSPGQLRFKVKE